MLKLKNAVTGDSLAVLSVLGMAVVVLLDAARQGQRPLALNKHCRQAKYLPCNTVLNNVNVRELESKGFLVLDNVLDSIQLATASSDAKDLQSSLFDFPNSTSVARSDILRYLSQVDRDTMTDVSPKSSHREHKGLLHAQNIVRGVGERLLEYNFAGFDGVAAHNKLYDKHLAVPDEVQLSLYRNSGTSCVAHRDGISLQFLELGILQWLKLACCRVRVVTAILYLNDAEPVWSKEEDGGCLRLHLGADVKDDIGRTAVSVIDIAPKGGRLVLFESQEILHEVLETRRDRSALTVWFTIGKL